MTTKPTRIGKYEIVAELGRGGFATVYKARDVELERAVALKVLHPYYAEDRQFVDRFRQEARAAARLRHPHIVTVYEAGEANDQTRPRPGSGPPRRQAQQRDSGTGGEGACIPPSEVQATLTDFGLVKAWCGSV